MIRAQELASKLRLLLRKRIGGRATIKLVQVQKNIAKKNANLAQARSRIAEKDLELKKVRRQMEVQYQELARLRATPKTDASNTQVAGIKPESIIWVFGTARTGSTWFSTLMGDPPEHEEWREPQVGDLFGSHYYKRLESKEYKDKKSKHWERFYVLGHDEARRNSIRSFVLEGARTRFPELPETGYLIVKEPHGSMGAPLLMEALPESRMVFLIRDPRDVASSHLNARQKGSWIYQRRRDKLGGENTLGDVSPDKIVAGRAQRYLSDVSKAKEAYEAHEGYKVLVRYEDLRTDTLGTLKRIYRTLNIPVDEAGLNRTVEKHSFENIPEEERGPGKFRRKATPGGWREDLTAVQVEMVERITAPLLREYYADEASGASLRFT
jgi:hypothetical protein